MSHDHRKRNRVKIGQESTELQYGKGFSIGPYYNGPDTRWLPHLPQAARELAYKVTSSIYFLKTSGKDFTVVDGQRLQYYCSYYHSMTVIQFLSSALPRKCCMEASAWIAECQVGLHRPTGWPVLAKIEFLFKLSDLFFWLTSSLSCHVFLFLFCFSGLKKLLVNAVN